MRSRTLRFLLPLVAALAAAGCKKAGVDGPADVCLPVSVSCTSDAQCCSYGCVAGACRQNPLEGGACRTSDDCQYPRVCVSEACTSTVACRGGASSCLYGSDCCSGGCNGGLCTTDLPPVAQAGADALPDQPYRIPLRLDGSASTDPNTGTVGLVYEWTVVSGPTGSTAAPTPAGVVNPTFTPDVADAVVPYVIQLKVTKGALSSTDRVTFKAVNTPPLIAMPADIAAPAYQSRNVALTFSATVTDADGGPVTCSWAKTSPSGVTTEVVAPYACAGASGVAATGQPPFTLREDEAGIWRVTLTATDGVNPPAVKNRFVYVENDPPVANAGPRRYGNYGLDPVPVAGTATDVNGDVTGGNLGDSTFTWLWTVTARPTGSTINLGTVVGTTPSVSFTPDAEGVFQLTLTVDDGHGGPRGGSASSTVEVQVDPYILTLGEVADVEYVDGTNQIVLVETGAGGAGALKIVDPATLKVVDEIALAARPTCVGLDPTGTEALVGEAGGIFQRVTGISATPSLAIATTVGTGSAMPADLADVVHAGTCAYGVTGSGTVYQLNPAAAAAPWFLPVACPTCTAATAPQATRASATASTVWLLQTVTGRLGRYDIHTNCNLQNAQVRTEGTLQGTAGIWRSADDADLFTTRSNVYSAADLTARIYGLTLSPDHLETTLSSGMLVGAVAQNATTALATFDRLGAGTTFTRRADVPYPILGVNGDAVSNYGRFGFVRSGGGAYYAIVRANVGTTAAPVYRWGLVNLGP